MRGSALVKLTDQNILSDIAKNHLYSSEFEIVLKKLTDQNILNDIAQNARDTQIQFSASLKLTDLSRRTDNLIRLFELRTRGYDKHLIVDQLKILFMQNILSSSDKAKILQLNGKLLVIEHEDYYSNPPCGNSHIDTQPEYFNL